MLQQQGLVDYTAMAGTMADRLAIPVTSLTHQQATFTETDTSNVYKWVNASWVLQTTASTLGTGTSAVGTVGVTSMPAIPAGTNNIGSIQLSDGVTPATKATVSNSHAGDEQVISAGNSLLVNAVGSIQGPVGKADVQRGIAFDGSPAVGIPAGAQNFAVPVNTTFGAGVTANAAAQSVLVASSAGMKVGSFMRCSAGTANQEDVFVTAVADATHFSAVFTKNHTNGDAITGFTFNVARDASVGDQVALTGFSASATFLWNAITNLAEIDRSADGERDGASGKGTAIAAEFEWNGGGPPTNAGTASLLQYDRARNLQGKGVGAATQNAGGAAGATSITASSAAATNTLQPGEQIRIDRNTGTEESAYVATNYVPGTAAITLQSALQFTHTAAALEWDIFASSGPGLNGFTAAGIGIEEEALYNPVDGKYYVERSATQDAMPAANIVAENPAVWNGATMDRMRGNVDTAALITAAGATTTQTGADQTNVNGRGVKVVLDMTTVGTGSVTLTIQGKDAASGKYYTLLAGASVTTNSTNVYEVYPGIPAAANAAASATLPRTWRVLVTANNANPSTYTVGASVIV